MASNPLVKTVFRLIQISSNLATLMACRLTSWTGKCPHPIHPKNLVVNPAGEWYVAGIKPGDLVLDVGAGVASHAVRCARAGGKVIAAELSERNIGRARSLIADSPVSLVRCDATRTFPFRSGVFAGALLLDVLEHFDDPMATLRETVRVLRPGGWVGIALPNSETTWKRRYRRAGVFWMSDRDHKHEYTWPEIVDMIESAGLRLQSGPETIVYDTPLTGLVDLTGALSLRLYLRLTDRRIALAARHPQESTGFRCTAIKP